MILRDFYKQLQRDPEWEDNNIKTFLVESLQIVENGGQVRQKGISASHVRDIAESIEVEGLLCPITIDNNNVVVEGNHRVKAFLRLLEKYPKTIKYKTIRAYKKSFPNDFERLSYQMKCNSHLPAKASSKEDWQAIFTKMIKTGEVSGLTWGTLSEDAKNPEILKDWAKEIFDGIHPSTLKSAVDSVFKGIPNPKIRNYAGAQDVLKKFSENNTIGWEKKAKSNLHGKQYVCQLASSTHLTPNVDGHAYDVKTNYPNVSVNLVAYNGNTTGLTGAKLDEWRLKILASVNTLNSSSLLDTGKCLIDKAFFAPQKMTDSMESPCVFYEVKRVNGNFPVKMEDLPTNGW